MAKLSIEKPFLVLAETAPVLKPLSIFTGRLSHGLKARAPRTKVRGFTSGLLSRCHGLLPLGFALSFYRRVCPIQELVPERSTSLERSKCLANLKAAQR